MGDAAGFVLLRTGIMTETGVAVSNAVSGRRMWIALACLLGAGSMLGITTTLAKLASETQVSSYGFLAWSVAGAAIILTSIMIARGGRSPLAKRHLGYLTVASLVTVMAPNIINFLAVPRIGAGFVALTLAFPPLLTYVGAVLLGIEPFKRGRAAGVLCALCGGSILAFYKLSSPDADIRWILAVLCVPIILAIGNIYRTLRWPADADAEQLTLGMLIVSAALIFLAAIHPELSIGSPLGDIDSPKLIAVQSAVFAVLYTLLFVLQKVAGPVYLSFLGSVGAIIGVLAAIWFLGESLPQGTLPAASLIGVGIWLVNRQSADVANTVDG